MSSTDRKKALAVHKAKMSKLFSDIDAQDSQHANVLTGNKQFMDAQYNASPEPIVAYAPKSKPAESTRRSSAAQSEATKTFNALFGDDDAKSEVPSDLKNKVEMKKNKPEKKDSDKLTVHTRKKIRKNSNTSTATAQHSSGTTVADTSASKGSISFLEDVSEMSARHSVTALKGIIKSKQNDGETDTDVTLTIEDDYNAEERFRHAVAALGSLQTLNFIFMQRLLDYSEIEASGVKFHKAKIELAYQILTIQGTLLFLMEQHRIKCSAFIMFTKKSFENTLYDIYGTKVLKFIGPMFLFSRMISNMMITDAQGRLLGYVKTFGKKCNYSVYTASGERIFLVVSNVFIPSPATTFQIIQQGQKIGVIRYGWKHVFHDLPYIKYETAGAEVPPEMDEREKALLLGCMVLLEFVWYSPITKLRLSMLVVSLLLFVFAITLIIFPLLVDKQHENPETRSFYTADQPKAEGLF